jgi:cytosine/uracil/thiamine/allantoin permease
MNATIMWIAMIVALVALGFAIWAIVKAYAQPEA